MTNEWRTARREWKSSASSFSEVVKSRETSRRFHQRSTRDRQKFFDSLSFVVRQRGQKHSMCQLPAAAFASEPMKREKKILIMNKYALCVSFGLSFDVSSTVINVKNGKRLLNFRSLSSWLGRLPYINRIPLFLRFLCHQIGFMLW